MQSIFATLKKWADLSAAEETEKLHEIGKLQEKHGLSRIEAVSADHLVYMLKSGFTQKQSKLMISGKVEPSMALNARKFTQEVKTMLSDVNPYTYLVQVDVQPVPVGAPFNKILGLAKLMTGESASLEHTQGVPMLLNFWAAWCQPSIKHSREIAKLTGDKKVRFVSISVDSEIGKAQQAVKAEGFEGFEQLHMGESTIDLEYGSSKMPRIVLVDGNGQVVYIGHPKKLKVKEAIEVLSKNEKLELDPLLLQEDDYSAPQPTQSLAVQACDTESGVFREDLALETVREEMSNFVTALKTESVVDKKVLSALDTDFLLILRQTKLEGGKLVTKYQLVNTLAGAQEVVEAVRNSLSTFLNNFHGSFNTQWAMSVLA